MQGHRHGIGLVGAGIVKFSVDHDSHSDQVSLAVGGELDQRERPRFFAGVSALGYLGEGEREKRQANYGEDGGPRQFAIS